MYVYVCMYVCIDVCMYVLMYVCIYVCMYVFYIFEYIYKYCTYVDLIHTYSSDALAQGILKSFFAFTNFLMPLPRSEPVAPGLCMYVCRAIPHGGPTELFFILASAPQLLLQRPVVCTVLFVGWRI